MRSISLIVVVGLQLICSSTSQTLPEDIQICRYGDLKCIKDVLNSFIRRFPKGLPDIGLDPIDKIKLKDYQFWSRSVYNAIGFKLKLYSQKIYGIENTTVTKVMGFGRNPEVSPLEIHGRIPSLVHKCSFNSNGRVHLLNYNSTGKSNSDFQNMNFILKLKVLVEYHNNTRYLKIYDLEPIVTTTRWIFKLDNLFKDNTDMTLIFNRLMNDNWLTFWNVTESRILDIARRLLKPLLQKMLDKIPYDQLFIKDSMDME